MQKPRAFLIDSSIYIFRAWHIYDNRITDSDGRPLNAVMGFADFLWRLIKQENPAYIACAFDESQTNSYRRELFPQYKANRTPAPAALKYQFQLCRDFCRAVGVADFGSNRYEADDIIGTLAARLRAEGFAVTVVSADKDLTQLVLSEDDTWWDFARGTLLNPRGVEKHFGVRPEQVADMLALSGDKVDNIPGIPGIGYKMAAKILQKFPSVEHLLENLDRVAHMKFRGAARIQALLHTHQALLPLNKKLTTIITDVDCGDTQGINWRGIHNEAFSELCEQLSVNSLIRQRWRNHPINT